MKKVFQSLLHSTLKSTVVQYKSWPTGTGIKRQEELLTGGGTGGGRWQN